MNKFMQFLEENTRPRISSKSLAKQLGVTEGMISLYRNGKRKPPRSKLKLYARVTGLNVEDFV